MRGKPANKHIPPKQNNTSKTNMTSENTKNDGEQLKQNTTQKTRDHTPLSNSNENNNSWGKARTNKHNSKKATQSTTKQTVQTKTQKKTEINNQHTDTTQQTRKHIPNKNQTNTHKHT